MRQNKLTALARRWIRRHIGLWPVLEFRNKLTLGRGVAKWTAFENAEVARLKAQLGAVPTATVACIMPTYKRPLQLLDAVKSVLAQEFQDFVIIIVDDGAGLPDDLPDDPRISAVSLSRNTAVLGLVRNVGIRLSSSKYLAFLDDDNTWTPQHLKVAVAALEGGADFIYTAILRRMDGEEFDIISRPFDRGTFRDETNYVDANSIVLRRTPRSLFSRLPRRKDTQPKEDWEFVYRMTRGARVQHVPVPTVEYLINFESFYTEWIL